MDNLTTAMSCITKLGYSIDQFGLENFTEGVKWYPKAPSVKLTFFPDNSVIYCTYFKTLEENLTLALIIFVCHKILGIKDIEKLPIFGNHVELKTLEKD